MSKTKIMVIYETAGGGHVAAAKAIEAALASMYPGAFDVVLMPVRTATGSQRVSHLMEAYNHLLKIKPSYSNMGLRMMNSLNVEKYVSRLLPKAAAGLRKTFESVKPDMIISVFGVVNQVALEIMNDLGWRDPKGRPEHYRPYVIWCTDLTNGFLRNWAQPDADITIALHEQARDLLVEYGVPQEKVHVLSGLPVNEKFLARVPKEEARAALGLDPQRFTVLISMGAVAVGASYYFTRELANSGLYVQIVTVCGRNERLRERCERIANDPRTQVPVKAIGFTDQMHLLMDAADVIVGKSGTMTIAEAIAKELPMLIDATRVPMLQEAGNLELVVRQKLGCAIKNERGDKLTDLVYNYMTKPALYEQTRQNLRRAKNDRAIEELIEIALAKLPGGPPARAQVSEQA